MRLENAEARREWAQIDAAVFRTITGADWLREVTRARAEINAVSERIRQRLGKFEGEQKPKQEEPCTS